jgi:hypothetical protein
MEAIFLAVCWAAVALASLLTSQVRCIRDWTAYGMGRKTEHANASCASPTVPRAWFWHMYAVGLVALVLVAHFRGRSVVSDLFIIHLARRLLECFYVQRPRATLALGDGGADRRASAQLPISVYLGGVAHYILCAWTLSLFAHSHTLTTVGWYGVALTCVFFVLQFWAHFALGELRSGDASTQSYRLPAVAPFTTLHLTHPHYLADAGIYGSLCVVAAGLHSVGPGALAALSCLAAWCTCNLLVTASYSLSWYREHFGAAALDAAGLHWAMIPFVW